VDLFGLIATCAPMVAPDLMLALVEAESGGHPYAIHDGEHLHRPQTAAEAIVLASRLTGQGRVIRAGLAQMTSTEWESYGLDIRSAFDPCSSLKAGERALLEGYQQAPEGIRGQRRARPEAGLARAPGAMPDASAPNTGVEQAGAPAWAFVPVADGFGAGSVWAN
jgi:type IV secretion system protein VirB1